jgi:hypothetical protein
MNQDFGAQTYSISWRPSAKYVQVVCQISGCPYSIWFSYDTPNNKNKPENLKIFRNTTLSHHVAKHENGKTRTSAVVDLTEE